MKRLASVLLFSILLVGAALPASALAESPDVAAARKDKVKVQVIQLRGEDIGPVTYRESKTFKADEQTTVVEGLSTTVTTTSVTAKEAGWYSADKTINRKSWLGIWVYSLTITANYHTNGKIIDEYGDTDWAASTAITWSSTNERSRWTLKGKTRGRATASAKFINAIPTPIGGIQIRQVSDSVTSFVSR